MKKDFKYRCMLCDETKNDKGVMKKLLVKAFKRYVNCRICQKCNYLIKTKKLSKTI